MIGERASEGELPGRLRRPDHARLVDVPEGGLELFAALVSGLASGSVPAAARLPRLGGGVEHVLIERRPGPGAELSVSAIPGPLASLLEVGAVGVATDHLRAHLRAEGTDGTEDEILAGLVADRLLVEA